MKKAGDGPYSSLTMGDKMGWPGEYAHFACIFYEENQDFRLASSNMFAPFFPGLCGYEH